MFRPDHHPESPSAPLFAPPASVRESDSQTRERAESVFAAARDVLMRARGALDPAGKPLLGQTMSWDDLRAMTEHHPDVEAAIALFQNEVARILEAFALEDYRPIPDGAHLEGRPDRLSEHRLLDGHEDLRTDPHSRIVLHPATWDKLAVLAREFRQRYGEPLVIASGYRSDAYQLYLLAYNASRLDDPENPGKKIEGTRPLAEVFRTVAPPGCSEHSMRVPAFDVRNWMDRPRDLRSLGKWAWFRDRALSLGIVESYPADSINAGYGEPWHFRDEATMIAEGLSPS